MLTPLQIELLTPLQIAYRVLTPLQQHKQYTNHSLSGFCL